jgi:hypothetical protein
MSQSQVIAIHTSGVGRSGCNPGDNCGTLDHHNVAWFYQTLGAPPPDTDCQYSPPPYVTLSGLVSQRARTDPGCPGGLYAQGDTSRPDSLPASGYEFVSWSGNNDNGVNPTTVTINGNTSVTVELTRDNLPI